MRPHEPLVLRLAWGKGTDLQKEIEEIRINKKLKQVKKKKKKRQSCEEEGCAVYHWGQVLRWQRGGRIDEQFS